MLLKSFRRPSLRVPDAEMYVHRTLLNLGMKVFLRFSLLFSLRNLYISSESILEIKIHSYTKYWELTFKEWTQLKSQHRTFPGKLTQTHFQIVERPAAGYQKEGKWYQESTASIFSAYYRETPNTSNPDRISYNRQEKFKSPGPLSSVWSFDVRLQIIRALKRWRVFCILFCAKSF